MTATATATETATEARSAVHKELFAAALENGRPHYFEILVADTDEGKWDLMTNLAGPADVLLWLDHPHQDGAFCLVKNCIDRDSYYFHNFTELPSFFNIMRYCVKLCRQALPVASVDGWLYASAMHNVVVPEVPRVTRGAPVVVVRTSRMTKRCFFR